MNPLAVALGGAVGSLLRWSLTILLKRAEAPLLTASVATLVANVAAAAVLGYLMARPHPDARIQLALATGVCGGFSTMSTFSWEAIQWAKSGSWFLALGYLATTLVLSIGAATAAYTLANK
jgi:CrcB protein